MLEIWEVSEDPKTDLHNSKYKYILMKWIIKCLFFSFCSSEISRYPRKQKKKIKSYENKYNFT